MTTTSLAEALRVLFDERNRVSQRQGSALIRLTVQPRDGIAGADDTTFTSHTAWFWDGANNWDGSKKWGAE